MNQPAWKFRLIDEMETANKLLDVIFENPRAADKLERKLTWMIDFVRRESGGTARFKLEWEKYVESAEDLLTRPTKLYEERVVNLERAREWIHRIINNSILDGWRITRMENSPVV